jgi:hypothetical protein
MMTADANFVPLNSAAFLDGGRTAVLRRLAPLKSAPCHSYRQLDSRPGAELLAGMRQVRLNRMARDEETPVDLGVRQAF